MGYSKVLYRLNTFMAEYPQLVNKSITTLFNKSFFLRHN